MASITVWERLVLMTPARSVLAAMVTAAGGFPESLPSVLPESFSNTNKRDNSYHSLDEVNLLEGLSLGTPFLLFAYNPFIAYSADLGTYAILSLAPLNRRNSACTPSKRYARTRACRM